MSEEKPQAQNTGADFDNTKGESFVGLNLLKLQVGEADGPFVVSEMKMKEFGKGTNKKELPQVVGTKGSTPYTMPIAASWIARVEESGLKKGDEFMIKRTPDYVSTEFGTEGCQSYLLKITKRA